MAVDGSNVNEGVGNFNTHTYCTKHMMGPVQRSWTHMKDRKIFSFNTEKEFKEALRMEPCEA